MSIITAHDPFDRLLMQPRATLALQSSGFPKVITDLFAPFGARYVVPQPPRPRPTLLDVAFHGYPLRLPMSAPVNIGVGPRP